MGKSRTTGESSKKIEEKFLMKFDEDKMRLYIFYRKNHQILITDLDEL